MRGRICPSLNCPHHIEVYKHYVTYRELPTVSLKSYDATLWKSGVFTGLQRNEMSQRWTYFRYPEQIEDERKILQLIIDAYEDLT